MIKKRLVFFILTSLFFVKNSNSQSVNPYVFVRTDTILVKSGGQFLKFPWAGGINCVQVGAIDLNLDGKKDLVTFDRAGNKLSTYINNGTANTVDYSFKAEYRAKFPLISDFLILYDYNCDGKEDIFTYSSGGMACYKNISNSANGLKFELVTDLILSKYGSNWYNLYVSPVDIPALVDLDNDGDMDILTFSILGSYVEHHLNKSKELYGVCDSLAFEMVNQCWGSFYENSSNNNCTLGITCKGGITQPLTEEETPKSIQHAGSTLLALDLDNDGDKELMLGDVSHNNIVLLINGGNATTANMTSQLDSFPANSKKVNLFEFPGSFYVDVNNDGKKDLLFSPNTINSENKKSVWFYKNTGTAVLPVFTFDKENFLQDEMIDVGECAYPVFTDFDNDGLIDIAVGSAGYYQNGVLRSKLAIYRNFGSATQPKFQLISDDYSTISQHNLTGLYPSFGDIDGDGDKDLIAGLSNGTLVYFENTAAPGSWASYTLNATNYKGIAVGQYASPQLIDVNRDGLLDLLIGNKAGKISYYKNTGTASNAIFTLITSNFGAVNVAAYGYSTGYSTPRLVDNLGVYTLFSGAENGGINRYTNIDNNLTGAFTRNDSTYTNIYEGSRVAIDIKDITGDGYPEMIIGNYSGGISFYINDPSKVDVENRKKNVEKYSIYPNPANNCIMLECANKQNIKLYNLFGQELAIEIEYISETKTKIKSPKNLNGIYILQFDNNEITVREKIIIQN